MQGRHKSSMMRRQPMSMVAHSPSPTTSPAPYATQQEATGSGSGLGERRTARRFTKEEVAQHNTETDFYSIVDGRVYDLTRYLRLHPGGFKLLFKNAGGDSSADFVALRHSTKAKHILEQYFVGELDDGGKGSSSLSVNRAGPLLSRPVGAMVGPQQYLNVGPSSSSSQMGPPPPRVPKQTLGWSGPTPKGGTLHASVSHPDRLSSYSMAPPSAKITNSQESKQNVRMKEGSDKSESAQSAVSTTVDAPFSIHVLPPLEVTNLPLSIAPGRSPLSFALDRHLAQSENLSPDEEMKEEEMQPFPSFNASQKHQTSDEARLMSVSVERPSAPASIVSMSDDSDVTPSILKPRLFRLTHRSAVTHNVQRLHFVPADVRMSIDSPSIALDPSLWMHIPPGLHISVGFEAEGGEYVKRPYTPVANVGGTLELLVKRYDGENTLDTMPLVPPSHGVSSYLHGIPLNTVIDMWGPSGRFEYETMKRRKKQWVCIAQGTGIAPMYQLIVHVCAAAKTSATSASSASSQTADSLPNLFLIDCNRHEQDILLRSELDTLASESGGRFSIQHLLSQPKSSNIEPMMKGRLNAINLVKCLERLFPAAHSSASNGASSLTSWADTSTQFLICGSDAFASDASRWLLELSGVQSQDIFTF